MKRSEIISRVVENTGRTDRAVRAGQAIRDALLEAGQMHRFRSMHQEFGFTFFSGSNALSLDESVYQVLEVRVLNGSSSYPLHLRSKSWVVRHYPNFGNYPASTPRFAYIEGGQLFVVPAAGSDLPGVYTALVLPDLTDDSADLQPNLLATYVIAYATAEVYRSVEMFDEAGPWDLKAAQRLQLAIKADNASGEDVIADQFPDQSDDRLVDPYHDPFYGTRGPL